MDKLPQTRPDIEATRQRVKRLAWLLDQSIALPVIGRRIGMDGLIGLIPGVGDLAGGALSTYLIWLSHRCGAPRALKWRMARIVLLETILGSVPLAGDLFDFGYRANAKIARLLEAHLDETHADREERQRET